MSFFLQSLHLGFRRLIWALLLSALPISAQSVSGLGAVTGSVRDPSGATVASAQVRLVNDTLGVRRETATTSAGVFHFPSLTPGGGYRLEVLREGFAPHEVNELSVRVGQIVSIDIELSLAGTRQVVEVVADPLGVEHAKTGVGDVVAPRQIMDLPINGRRVDSFVLLTPGVVPEGNFGLLSFRGIPGGNSFLTDGNDTTNQLWNENAGRTRIASNISQDAVQEFQVLTSGYSAEFGRAVGGVINTVTRSGGNQVSGTAFWLFRNQDFNALDRYAKALGQPNPEERRNQFGGTIGGPILRDKLFYFGNAEFTRRYFPIISSLTTPPLFDPQGNFVGACGSPATPQQCEAAVSFVSRFRRTVPREASNNLGFAKLDFRPSNRNAFTFSFNLLNWNSPNGIQTGAVLVNGAALGSNGNSEVKTRFGRASWTAIVRPDLVNEARFGWMKDRLFDTLNPDLIPPTGIATITVQGVANLGAANYLPRVFPTEDRWQAANILSWTRGRQLIKLGFDFSHVRDVQDQVFNGNGSYTYATFTDFALDYSGNTGGGKRWQSYSQGFGPPLTKTWIRDFAWFLQDQWQVRRDLTLNLGFRGETAQFAQPVFSNPDYPQTARIPQPGLNAAPRIGLAWSPLGSRTVFRAGYGLFYARIPGGTINWLHRDNSAFQFTVLLQGNIPEDRAIGPVFPSRIPDTGRRPAPGTTSITMAADHWRTPYTQQGDIAIEHQVARDTLITVSYLWNRGLAFTTVRDANIGPMGPPVTYRILDEGDADAGSYTTPTYLRSSRIDTRYQRIGVLESDGNVYYNALAVQLRHLRSKWLDGQISYTWGHAIDYNLGVTGDNLFFGSTPRTLFNGDHRGDKGTSETDQRHRLVVNFISDLVFGLRSRWLSTALDRWQLSGIYTYATGPHATPTIFVSGVPFSGAAFNSTLNGLGGSNRVPFLPRSFLDVGAISRLDMRLSKNFVPSERWRLTVLLEAFNLTNSQYDTAVRTQAFQASGGILRPTPRLGEGTQSAGFPDGTNARRAQIGLRLTF